MPAWTPDRTAQLEALWRDKMVTRAQIAERMGTSYGAAQRIARKNNWPPRGKGSRNGLELKPEHDAIRERRTLFQAQVFEADDPEVKQLLVEGRMNRKLGANVTKGRWKGAVIYHLTLEERETCPRSCSAWRFCYGNNMHFARRHVLSDRLMERLDVEVDHLCNKHSEGILVRLHTLGDFGQPGLPMLALRYVRFWRDQLQKHPNLHIFGFTAHGPETLIGERVLEMTESTDRCWIRFSDRPDLGRRGAGIIELHDNQPGLPCPYEQQKQRVRDCGSCGLCWTMEKSVLFARH